MLVYINDKYKDIFMKYKLQYQEEIENLKLEHKKINIEKEKEWKKAYNKAYKIKNKEAIAKKHKLYKQQYMKIAKETLSTSYINHILRLKKLKPTEELQRLQKNIIILKNKQHEKNNNSRYL